MSSTTTLLAPIATDTREERENQLHALFRHEQARARSLVWRILGRHHAATDDVVQSAFVKSWKKVGTLQNPDKMKAWLFQIVVREAYSHIRRQKVKKLLSFGSCSPDTLGTVSPEVDPALRAKITEAMTKLPTMQKTTFTLIHLEGFTVLETADILQIAPGTVKSHLHRALKHLRRELRELAPMPSGKQP